MAYSLLKQKDRISSERTRSKQGFFCDGTCGTAPFFQVKKILYLQCILLTNTWSPVSQYRYLLLSTGTYFFTKNALVLRKKKDIILNVTI